MRMLDRLLRPTRRIPSVTFSESHGEACTAACLTMARLERNRTAALRSGMPR